MRAGAGVAAAALSFSTAIGGAAACAWPSAQQSWGQSPAVIEPAIGQSAPMLLNGHGTIAPAPGGLAEGARQAGEDRLSRKQHGSPKNGELRDPIHPYFER